MLFARRRARGPGLLGLVVIAGLLYFTGAGAWLWERTKQLPAACYEALSGMGSAASVCDALGSGIGALDHAGSSVSNTVKGWLGMATDQAGSGLSQFSQQLLAPFGNGGLGRSISGGDALNALMQRGPLQLPDSARASEQLRMALDQFVIGQQQLQGGETKQALPWFQQSAQQPGGYGVLSQLTLGDLYRTGNHGVGVNPSASAHYYEMAQASIQSLQGSNAPEAKQLLGGLPAEPGVLTQQIVQIVQSLKQ